MVELPPKRQPIPANKNFVIFAGIARVKNRLVLLGKGGESYFKLFRRQQIIATRNGTSTQSGIDINNHPAVKNIYITIAQKLQNAADNGAVQIAMRLWDRIIPAGKRKAREILFRACKQINIFFLIFYLLRLDAKQAAATPRIAPIKAGSGTAVAAKKPFSSI